MKHSRDMYYPKDATMVQDDESSAVAYLTESKNRPAAVLFAGRRQKPDHNYWYRSVEHRDKHVAEYFASIRASENAKRERQAKARGLDVGDILVSSWGYDQTNIEFYQVTALIGRTMVEIRPIASETVSEPGWMQEYVRAVPGSFVGKPQRRKASDGYVSITSFSGAWKDEPGKTHLATHYA